MFKYLIQLIVELIFIVVLFTKIFIVKNITLAFVLISLVIMLIISLSLYKVRSVKKRRLMDCLFIIGGCSVLLLGTMYLIGFKIGFNVNYNTIFKAYIEKSVFIKTILIVGISEMLRSAVCSINAKKKSRNILLKALLVILLVLVDCSITDKIAEFKTFTQFYNFFALVVFPSITKNILLNYMITRYSIYSTLLYRLIMDLYIFFLPVTPKFNIFIEASILLVYPYLLYTIIESICGDKELENARKKKHNIIYDIPLYALGLIIVILVSREFTYSMIAIGSGSMTGEFSKGDAVIYKSYDKKDATIDAKKLKKGDIIVFNMKDMVVVHRIYDSYSLYGEDVYITKGDANENADKWIVTQKDIIGVVKKKIKFIAWPSVWLTESFK